MLRLIAAAVLAVAVSGCADGGGSAPAAVADPTDPGAPAAGPQAPPPQRARVVTLSGRPVKAKEVYESGKPTNRTVTDADGYFDLPETPTTPVQTDLGAAAPIVTYARPLWSRLLEGEAFAAVSDGIQVQWWRSANVPTGTPVVLGFDVPTATAATLPPAPSVSPSEAMVDWDGDGKADRLALSGTSEVTIERGDGTGGYSAPTTVTTVAHVTGLIAPDLDGDGRHDLLVTGRFNAVAVYQTAAGGLRAQELFVGESAFPAVADLDGDGEPEAAFNGKAVLIVLRRSGAVQPVRLYNGPHRVMIVRDLNGDGIADVLTTALRYSALTIQFGARGAIAADLAAYSYRDGVLFGYVQTRDVDGDGTTDVLTSRGLMRGR